MYEALGLERFVDLVSSNRRFCMVLTMGLALRIGTRMLALLERYGAVCWDAVFGKRAISLNFLTLLFS